MSEILYIGTRLEAYKTLEIFSIHNFNKSVDVLTFEGTLLHTHLIKLNNDSINFKILPNNKKQSLEILNQDLSNNSYKILLSAGFPYLISKKILNSHSTHFLNIHPHVLPKWKGINAIKESLLENEDTFGATLHHINEKIDDGKIIYKEGFIFKNKELSNIYSSVFSIIEPFVLLRGLMKDKNLLFK